MWSLWSHPKFLSPPDVPETQLNIYCAEMQGEGNARTRRQRERRNS